MRARVRVLLREVVVEKRKKCRESVDSQKDQKKLKRETNDDDDDEAGVTKFVSIINSSRSRQ